MTKAKRNICLIAAAAAALSTTALLPGHAAAVQSKPADSVTTTIQVVATGLDVPRGLVYDQEHGRILIAESGVATGNTSPCQPGGDDSVLCLGETGSVYSYVLPGGDGQSGRIITGLPSVSNPDQNFVKGIEDLSLYHGRLYGIFSLAGTASMRTALGPEATDLGQAVRFGRDGSVTPIADIAGYENQLYGPAETSDPWGISVGKFGVLVANADGLPVTGSLYGGNDVLQYKHHDLGQMVAFPARPADTDPSTLVEAAPTTVEQGPDGAFYIGELTSYPYITGEARVWRLEPGQAPTVFASGFTKVIDLTFDPSGRMLVLEIGKQFQSGALVRINKDGTQTVLASAGMENPGGVVAVSDNTFYVTNNSGGVGGDGQLLKITVNDN